MDEEELDELAIEGFGNSHWYGGNGWGDGGSPYRGNGLGDGEDGYNGGGEGDGSHSDVEGDVIPCEEP